MQHRMKEFTMTNKAIKNLLDRSKLGRISTIGSDGYPYTVAIHFIYLNDKIYLHSLPVGEKIDNIKNNSKVCFEVDEYTKLLVDDLSKYQLRNAMDLIKLMMAYTGQRKDTARRNKSEVWRSVRNEKKKISAIICFITSLLFYINAILNFSSEGSMGVVYICLGSTFFMFRCCMVK